MIKRPRPSRGRPPKGAERLSRQAILDAALEVIDAHGAAAVSMRSVAGHMGVDAKSLYNHVDGKEGLLDAVAEHLLTDIRLPEPTGALADDLRAIAQAFRRATLAHPQAATLVLTRQLSSLASLAPTEAVVSALLRAGFPPDEAVHLLRSFLAMAIGTLLREASADPTFGVSDDEGIARRRQVLENAGLPALTEAAPHLARCDHREEFDFAVDLLIEAATARQRR
ncbi:TetR/AcrR family transcriptional regulator C-terminal domain-containing protein [Chondromyces crocatus]|uniref:TetR/AcrR family transcriptional regulator C-terminal domain-containing protein n=1 Tax=Chondromyces crocatus TaxID=52 RepID=UPI00067B485A|nr:TetR/AcrR family transcriptional regulator C-terminal domain-containing protein [Chondromyces crocatus]